HLKTTGCAVVVKGAAEDGTDWGEEMCRTMSVNSLIRCGISKHGCQVYADKVVQTLDGFHCQLDLNGARADFSSELSGGYNVLNVLAAAGVGLGLGLSPEQICQGLARVKRIPGRLERISLPGAPQGSEPAIFVDYAHTPDALDNVLRTLQPLTARRLICVFGCGGDRDRSKRPQMGSIAVRHANVTIITSDNPRTERPEEIVDEIVQGAARGDRPHRSITALFDPADPQDGYAVLVDRRTAIATACSLAQPGDTVLIAGKGHENYQILGATRQFFDDRREAANGLLRWNEQHLVNAIRGTVISGSQVRIFENISTDSRTLKAGDVFVALKGESFDGHRYIDAAVQAGAAAVVAERIPAGCNSAVLCIQVQDSLQALGRLAAYRRRLLNGAVQVAAITGSSGKTTVKELVAAIFNEALLPVRSGTDPLLKTEGNFNNLVGLPLSLLPVETGHRLAVLEMGMNAPGEIAQLTEIADPDIGCINNVHPAHLQGLGNLQGVAAAKGELFAGMRPDAVRVVNCDDPLIRALADRTNGKFIGFAGSSAGRRYKPQVRATRQVNLGEKGMRFTLHIGSWQHRITVPLHGSHNVSNCLAAAAVGHAAGIGSEIIARALEGYVPAVDRRLAITELPGGLKVVNDAYNANPASMAAGLYTVASFGTGCRRIAALGDMLELGSSSVRLHADIGSLVARLGYDRLFLTGSFAKAVADAAQKGGMDAGDIQIFSSPRAMAEEVWRMLELGTLGKGDWLFVKGSRGMRMERLLDELLQRIETSA
ncbi:MAG: UDP-N-acetylmuramoyl-tripeptide--D-alanyl-D-alanine ligase, partial [Desulfobulbus sp.]|nr:UDP-N-acetylmuramoyl-tripeptide--D-alanyl-D-alanine ligase [Desulfobulbus sp.]